MEEKKECCHCHKTKERSEKEYKDMINRLSRIEGQVRGVKRMVEEDAYCPDILIREGKDETIDELVVTLQTLMK